MLKCISTAQARIIIIIIIITTITIIVIIIVTIITIIITIITIITIVSITVFFSVLSCVVAFCTFASVLFRLLVSPRNCARSQLSSQHGNQFNE